MEAGRPRRDGPRWTRLPACSAAFALLEQCGQTTNDTKTGPDRAPGRFLREHVHAVEPADDSRASCRTRPTATSSRRARSSRAASCAHVPPLGHRAAVVGAGADRRRARAPGGWPGRSGWAPWAAVGGRDGLRAQPAGDRRGRRAQRRGAARRAVLPWVLLPIVLALTGRTAAARGSVVRGGVHVRGAVNGTATAAPAAAGGDRDRGAGPPAAWAGRSSCGGAGWWSRSTSGGRPRCSR